MNITQKKEIVDNILELLIQLTEDGENTVPQTTAAPTSNKIEMLTIKEWFCQYHLTHFIRTRIMQRERYDHSRAFFELPEAAHRWRCRFFC